MNDRAKVIKPTNPSLARVENCCSSRGGSFPLVSVPNLSVIIPVFNEAPTILELLRRVRDVPVVADVHIVDDASTDGTRQLLEDHVDGMQTNVRVYYHSQNKGKGAAILTALPYLEGDFCIIQDADLECDPTDFIPIMAAFVEHGADVVYGSRFRNGWPAMPILSILANFSLTWLVRTLFGTAITDEATCYKAFRSSLFMELHLICDRFDFDAEVTAKVLRRGYNIIELPIRYSARSRAEGKKVRWPDWFSAVWTLIKYRVTSV